MFQISLFLHLVMFPAVKISLTSLSVEVGGSKQQSLVDFSWVCHILKVFKLYYSKPCQGQARGELLSKVCLLWQQALNLFHLDWYVFVGSTEYWGGVVMGRKVYLIKIMSLFNVYSFHVNVSGRSLGLITFQKL